jgi:probable F420-dependent oxidoreductase
MTIGAIIPNIGPTPSQLGITTMAREAEARGAEGLWISDHLLMVEEEVRTYPYTPDGRLPLDVRADFHECLTTCAAAAAVTSTAAVGSSVIVLPQRNPLQVAKEAATIDHLSAGRFILGVGLGWNGAEMEALGYPYPQRARRMDESLQVIRSCWTGTPNPFQGEQVSVRPGVLLFPTPVQVGGPPLLVGGMSPGAIRRAGRFGGWMAIAFIDQWEPDALRSAMAMYRAERAAGAGRWLPVLKLHCSPSNLGRLVESTNFAYKLGFVHVIVDLPWSQGLERALAVLTEVVENADVPPPYGPWWQASSSAPSDDERG